MYTTPGMRNPLFEILRKHHNRNLNFVVHQPHMNRIEGALRRFVFPVVADRGFEFRIMQTLRS